MHAFSHRCRWGLTGGWDAMHIPQIACQSNQCWYVFHHILPHFFGVSNSRGCIYGQNSLEHLSWFIPCFSLSLASISLVVLHFGLICVSFLGVLNWVLKRPSFPHLVQGAFIHFGLGWWHCISLGRHNYPPILVVLHFVLTRVSFISFLSFPNLWIQPLNTQSSCTSRWYVSLSFLVLLPHQEHLMFL